jgi:hypothetical protein
MFEAGEKRDTPKWTGNLECSGRDPKKDPDILGKKGYRRY